MPDDHRRASNQPLPMSFMGRLTSRAVMHGRLILNLFTFFKRGMNAPSPDCMNSSLGKCGSGDYPGDGSPPVGPREILIQFPVTPGSGPGHILGIQPRALGNAPIPALHSPFWVGPVPPFPGSSDPPPSAMPRGMGWEYGRGGRGWMRVESGCEHGHRWAPPAGGIIPVVA